MVMKSDFVVADVSVRSLQKVFILVLRNNIYKMKVSRKHLI